MTIAFYAIAFSITFKAQARETASVEQVISNEGMNLLSKLDINKSEVNFVAEGSEISFKIDNIVLRIFEKTNLGKVFCEVGLNNFDSFKKAFFVNKSKAEKAFAVCKNGEVSSGIDGLTKSSEFTVKDKKYFLYIGENKPLYGWTTSENETFIFMNKDEFDDPGEILLTRVLSHELAVSFDQKENIGAFGVLGFEDANANAQRQSTVKIRRITRSDNKINVSVFDSESLSSLKKIRIKQNEESKKLVELIRNSYIKHILTTARALHFEREIFKELRLSYQEPTVLAVLNNTSNCILKLLSIHQLLKPSYPLLRIENRFNELMDVGFSGISTFTSNIPSDEEIIKKISELNNLTIEVRINEESWVKKNACSFLSEGVPFYPGVSFRGGPGPRITDW